MNAINQESLREQSLVAFATGCLDKLHKPAFAMLIAPSPTDC
jgi:hypothetical protein